MNKLQKELFSIYGWMVLRSAGKPLTQVAMVRNSQPVNQSPDLSKCTDPELLGWPRTWRRGPVIQTQMFPTNHPQGFPRGMTAIQENNWKWDLLVLVDCVLKGTYSPEIQTTIVAHQSEQRLKDFRG